MSGDHAALDRESMIRWARQYIELGVPVVALMGLLPDGTCACGGGSACRFPGRHLLGPRECALPATHEDHLDRWAEFPYLNLALPTGAEWDVIVVNAPSRRGQTNPLIELQQRYETFPATWKWTNRGGLLCAAFRYPTDQTIETGSLLVDDRIVVRGERSHATLPPSTDRYGAYSWSRALSPNDLPRPADAPAWLCDLMRRTHDRDYGSRWERGHA